MMKRHFLRDTSDLYSKQKQESFFQRENKKKVFLLICSMNFFHVTFILIQKNADLTCTETVWDGICTKQFHYILHPLALSVLETLAQVSYTSGFAKRFL